MGSTTLLGLFVYSQPNMKLLVFLFASALALPRPAEEAAEVVAEVAAVKPEAPVAVPYVHEEIEAEPYVHEEIDAEPYVHDDIAAEAYVHEDIEAVPYVHEEVAYNHEDIPAEEYVHVEGPSAPAAAPLVYTGLPYVHAYAGYPYLTYHTGCVNNVGSVVPCA